MALRPVADAVDAGCPLGLCEGTGWLVDEEGDARRCECAERRIKASVGRQVGRGIPKRYRGVSFDRRPICDLDPSLLRGVRHYVRTIAKNLDEGRGLWIHGDVGTGKTSVAMLVARAAGDVGRSVAIYSVPQLLAELRGTYNPDSDASYAVLARQLASVDLLVLDDLGAEKHTDWVLEQLYSLVNERWQDGRAIIATSNSPDPHRDVTLTTLREEIEGLRAARLSGPSTAEIERHVSRLEKVAGELGSVMVTGKTDPVTQMRQAIGSRTVSRLIEICDEPLMLFGPDLRIANAGF